MKGTWRCRNWKIFHQSGGAILVITLFVLMSSCGNPFGGYEEYNPVTSTAVDFFGDFRKASFGESARRSNDGNWAEIDHDNRTIHITSYRPPAAEEFNAGKIANSLDGIMYVFREVPADRNFKLSATVEVLRFGGVGSTGETTSNGQEGFGLMARDFVPLYPGYTMADLGAAADLGIVDPYDQYFISSSAHSGRSNMIFAGGVKRGVRYGYRYGVVGDIEAVSDPDVQSDGSNAGFIYRPDELASYVQWPTLDERPDFPLINGRYRLTLEKTNSGFLVSMVPPAEKGTPWEEFIWEPDLLTAVDPDHYYVGFFAARAAEIMVRDIVYSESDSRRSAPRMEPEPLEVSPELVILSPTTNSHPQGRFYRIIAMANVPGYLSVRQDGIPVPGGEWVSAEWLSGDSNYGNIARPAYFDIPVRDLRVGENVFQIAFYPASEHPEEGYVITGTTPLTRTFLVERRMYFDAATDIYAAPSGRPSNRGTATSPLDLQTAIDFVQPGQTVILKNGVYEMLSFRIPRYNSGRFGAPKRMEAESPGEAVIDFKKNPYATGAVVEGSYWEISGIHFRNTPDKVKGFVVMGNNNVIEWVNTYDNGDTGFQISGSSTLPATMWPWNNTVRYSESFNNRDAAEIDADGFAAKLTVGSGNRFEWCLSHNNADDGWDLYSKVETGFIGEVVIENSISYRNGFLLDGRTSTGGKNGFKLGGEGMPIRHRVYNALAFENGANGFTGNSNPDIVLDRVTAFNNGTSNHRNYTIYDSAGDISVSADLTGILSLYSPEEGADRSDDRVTLHLPASGYAWVDGSPRNANDNTIDITEDIRSVVPPLWNRSYTSQVAPGEEGFIRRNPDGTFALGDFLDLIPALSVGASF